MVRIRDAGMERAARTPYRLFIWVLLCVKVSGAVRERSPAQVEKAAHPKPVRNGSNRDIVTVRGGGTDCVL